MTTYSQKILLSTLCLVVLCTGTPARAEPSRLDPGDPRIEGARLEPFRITTDWGTQDVTLGKVQGRDVINILNQVNLPSGELLVDHIVLDRASLALIFRFAPYFAIGQDYLVATLQGGAFAGVLHPLAGGETRVYQQQLDSAVFAEPTLGLLLAVAPLTADFAAELPRLAVSASSQDFSSGTLTVEVVGRERIKAGDRKHYETWVVEAKWGGADYSEKLWVAERPPYLIQKIAYPPGGGSRTSGFNSVETKER